MPKPDYYRNVGGALTVLWLVVLTYYLVSNKINPLDLPPEQFGNFAAGGLAPIGVIWIVLGFLLQGDELKNSVDALRRSVEQQGDLVDLTRRQLEHQIEALEEARSEKHNASLPILKMIAAGGSQSGDLIKSNIEMHNFGADCTEVKVFDLDGEFPQMIYQQPTLKRGASCKFVLSHGKADHLDFNIEVHFRSLDGLNEVAKFWLLRKFSDGPGFDVDEM